MNIKGCMVRLPEPKEQPKPKTIKLTAERGTRGTFCQTCGGLLDHRADMFMEIVNSVAMETGVPAPLILGYRRNKYIVAARQKAMYRCYVETDRSTTRVGRFFCRDHTTVLHAIRVCERRPKKRKTHAKPELREGR